MSGIVVCPVCGDSWEVDDLAYPDGGEAVCDGCARLADQAEGDWDELMEDDFPLELEGDARCSICNRVDGPMNECEVCGQWVCEECVISSGLHVRRRPGCAHGDGLAEKFLF